MTLESQIVLWVWITVLLTGIFFSLRNVKERNKSIEAVKVLMFSGPHRDGNTLMVAKLLRNAELVRLAELVILLLIAVPSVVLQFIPHSSLAHLCQRKISYGLLLFAILITVNTRYSGSAGRRLEQRGNHEA